jgi:hypothetical protein
VKIDLPDEYVPVTITALENYAAYMRVMNRNDGAALAAAEVFKSGEKKGPAREDGDAKTIKRKRA